MTENLIFGENPYAMDYLQRALKSNIFIVNSNYLIRRF